MTLKMPDVSKFKKATGWKAEIPFEKTAKDILDFWREKVKTEEMSKDELANLYQLGK